MALSWSFPVDPQQSSQIFCWVIAIVVNSWESRKAPDLKEERVSFHICPHIGSKWSPDRQMLKHVYEPFSGKGKQAALIRNSAVRDVTS